jgi:hypothetical protein
MCLKQGLTSGTLQCGKFKPGIGVIPDDELNASVAEITNAIK